MYFLQFDYIKEHPKIAYRAQQCYNPFKVTSFLFFEKCVFIDITLNSFKEFYQLSKQGIEIASKAKHLFHGYKL